MKVALVHDDLVQWGGAERVLLGLCQIFPDAPIFTSVFDNSNKYLVQKFAGKKIITSFLQKIPIWKKLYKAMLPIYPLAFEQFNFDDYDLVISHTTRFAKSIITKPQTKHVCYCHTPPRFLWRFSGFKSLGVLEILMTKLRIYDKVSASRVDYFIAGSLNAKKRIKKIYKKDSKVIYPFIDTDRFNRANTFNGGYYVIAGRPAKYKKFDVAIDACKDLNRELKVIDGNLDDETVVEILAGCHALIIPGQEDFGLVSLEAQALGKPVIAYKLGGSLETVIDGQTGVLFNFQTKDSLKDAILRLEKININPLVCIQNSSKFDFSSFKQNLKQVISLL
jgi:glycosyltransferase involved in cell wall biosynthesis